MQNRIATRKKSPGAGRKSSAPLATSPDDRPFRAELVARTRKNIAAGLYDTPEVWETALEKLLARLDD